MQRFAMSELFAALEIEPPDLLLRGYGQRAYPLLARAMEAIPSHHTFTLDFAGVSVMDTSFAEETVLHLALDLIKGEFGDRFMLLDQVSAATIDNIEATIAWRRAKVALPLREGGKIRLVGHIEPNLLEVWRLATEVDTLTARELADRLHLEINTASMRLRKLYDARLVDRKEEVSASGRQHVYKFPG